MKITVERKTLLATLGLVAGSSEQKSSVTILSYASIRTIDNGAVVQGTNLEISTTAKMLCEVQEEGAACLPIKKMIEIVKELEGDISIEVKDLWATIRCGKSKFRLATLPHGEWPVIPTQGETILSIPSQSFGTILGSVIYAADNKGDYRYTLDTMKLEGNENELFFVSTDGSRLAKNSYGTDKASGVSIMMSASAIKHIARVIASEPGDVVIQSLELGNLIVFRINEIAVTCRVVEGSFPNWKHVIPANHERELSIDKKSFVSALRRARLIDSDNKITLMLDTNESTIHSANSDIGESSEILECTYTGSPLKISASADYLLDAIMHIKSDNITLRMNGEMNPLVLEEGGYLAIVMPVKS